jgi:16S rRNA A1518/A1519 N6-dimethyltransferase RsmA/KsgA/DIM1 with predicted DNA glycosylase/AP lyase activity
VAIQFGPTIFGQKILEIGSGTGTYSTFLLGNERVWLSDYDPTFVGRLRQKFGDRANVTCHQIDLSNLDEI